MRSHVLLALCTVACSAGAGRDSANGSASIGESTGGGMTGPATDWTSGGSTSGDTTDASASADATSTGMGPTTASTTDDPSTDESTGGPTSCADDPAACEAWFLPRDAASWQAVMLGGPAALAPSSPVLAAFDIEAEQIGFVITATELIRVDLEQRAWVSKTELADTLPDVDIAVRGAWSIPAYWDMATGREGVAIMGDDVAFIYGYDAATDAFDFDQATAFGAEWSTMNAPDPSAIRDLWIDVTNDDGWVTNALDEVCDGANGPVGPHVAVVTDTSVHIDEAGTCFEFFDPVPYAQFAPFGLAGAPQAERIGGALYSESLGLVVFAGD
jgi:hypothetical protein